MYGNGQGGSDYNFGVYGTAGWSGASGNWAGYFDGNVYADNLYALSQITRIDHPLNSENRYLQHAGVESDEMMNIYNGNILLDDNGEARIELPDWFEAYNTDFRYQLTPIGGAAPNLYIAQEVENGYFIIAGGSPNLKISWQVTGTRHDNYARQHPLVVEKDKPDVEKGLYLHPESFNQPKELGLHHQFIKNREENTSARRVINSQNK